MDNPENWISCGVCSEKTRFCYLKTQLCRACAAFYRRAVTENIKYECQMEERCKLDDADRRQRTICPACRLRKCRQLAPRLKHQTDSTPDSTPLTDTSSETPDFLLLDDPTRPAFKETLIDALTNGYDRFLAEQRQRHARRHPKFDFSDGKIMLVKNRKLGIQMETSTLPLMFSMFNDYYGAFSGLPEKQKLTLAAHAAYEINHLNKAFLTSHFFPSAEDSRMAITNGYYVQMIQIDIAGYVYGLFMSKELEQFINIYRPLSRRRYRNLQNFKNLEMNKTDAVCMMFLTMCRQIEYLGFLNDEFQRMREQMLCEWFQSIKSRFGSAQATQKFGRIFCYYLETDNLCNDFAKTLTILALRNLRPDIKQIYDPANCMQILMAEESGIV